MIDVKSSQFTSHIYQSINLDAELEVEGEVSLRGTGLEGSKEFKDCHSRESEDSSTMCPTSTSESRN